jgi:hypothetical protein
VLGTAYDLKALSAYHHHGPPRLALVSSAPLSMTGRTLLAYKHYSHPRVPAAESVRIGRSWAVDSFGTTPQPTLGPGLAAAAFTCIGAPRSPGRRVLLRASSRSIGVPSGARHCCCGTSAVTPTDAATAAPLRRRCSTPAPPTGRSAPSLARFPAGGKQKSSVGAVDQTAGAGAKRSPDSRDRCRRNATTRSVPATSLLPVRAAASTG